MYMWLLGVCGCLVFAGVHNDTTPIVLVKGCCSGSIRREYYKQLSVRGISHLQYKVDAQGVIQWSVSLNMARAFHQANSRQNL